MESTDQRSTMSNEDTVPVRKHGIGKGPMTVWHAMYSHNVECQGRLSFIDETGCLRSLRPFDDCDGFDGQDNGKMIQVKSQVFADPMRTMIVKFALCCYYIIKCSQSCFLVWCLSICRTKVWRRRR
jgi:hypothetical protein